MARHPGRGAARGGWKLGVGDRERIGDELAVGHLTSATCLDPGAAYHADDAGDLRADAEVAFELGRDVDPNDPAGAAAATAGVGVALEIVDLARPPDDPVAVVAANVFHRAVAFGPFRPAQPAGGIRGRLLVNGQPRASAATADDLAGRLAAAARLLGAMGERLEAGAQIITGLVVQVPIEVDDEVVADMGPLGRVGLSIRP